MSEIYDLSKPDEMRGIVPTNSILPLNSHPEMLTLFRESEIIVAEQEGKVVGFAGNRAAYISWLFVHPDYRRMGIASSLVQVILTKLKNDVTLNVAKNNTGAIQLYGRFGFFTELEFEGQFNGQPCKVMRLRYAVS